jgi:hypothetical protein
MRACISCPMAAKVPIALRQTATCDSLTITVRSCSGKDRLRTQPDLNPILSLLIVKL